MIQKDLFLTEAQRSQRKKFKEKLRVLCASVREFELEAVLG
jgi:hypothetical protein